MTVRLHLQMLIVVLVVTGCDVPVRDLDTGGIALAGAGGWGSQAVDEAGAGGASRAEPACAHGFAVVSSDYQSSNVSLLDPTGEVLSASFISSGSTTAGLSASLSGDVVLPTRSTRAGRLALIDRSPASVLTWVDLRSGEVEAQLSVATGFDSNPHDYVELSPSKAYVLRFDENLASGREPFDGGNDVLVVDPTAPAITGRIDLAPAMAGVASRFVAHPDRAARVRDRVVVVLGVYRTDLLETAPSRLVVIDPLADAIVQTVVLDGYHACSSLAVSPDEDELAVACAGEWGGDDRPDIDTSGLVRLRVADQLEIVHRHRAIDFGQGPIAFGLDYASRRYLLLTTYGQFDGRGEPAADDTLIELDLETNESRGVLRSAGKPFTLGDVRCDSTCGVCVVTDAERQGGVVHRLTVEHGGVSEPTAIRVDDEIGLPPRCLAEF